MKNPVYGSVEFGYYAVGSGSYWFAKWMEVEFPASGFKFHIAPQLEDAPLIAECVLPKLREIRAAHKVVKNQTLYAEQWQTDQKGKFITVYTAGSIQGQRVIDAIDPELYRLRNAKLLSKGYPPSTRESDHQERELPIGRSGLIFTRWFEE